MRSRTVAELRESARRILGRVELEQVFAANSQLRTHDRFQNPPFNTETELLVAGRMQGETVEVWAKYLTKVLKAVDDSEDLDVWSVEVECVASFAPTPEAAGERFTEDDLEAFALLVGAPALHPYAREWTQTLSGHSMYPALTMGLMSMLAELPEDHEIEFPDRDEPDGASAAT